MCEKTGGGSAGVYEKTSGVCEASGWRPVVSQRHSKRKHMVQVEGGGKAGRLEGRAAAGDSSDSEASMSDSSELSLSQTHSHCQSGEKNVHSPDD